MQYSLYDYYHRSHLTLKEILIHYIENFYLRNHGRDKVDMVFSKLLSSTRAEDLFELSSNRRIVPTHYDFCAAINETPWFMFQSNSTQALAVLALEIKWNEQVNLSLHLINEDSVRDDAIQIFNKYSLYEEMEKSEFDRMTKSSIEKIDGDDVNNHNYVDLELPSGTLWATCNIGADTPEQYGCYFSWGEIKPKEIYNLSSYKHFDDNRSQLTKYCVNKNGYYGIADNLTVLEVSDDAASTIWGNGWRIPSEEEWNELIYNTQNIWTSHNGVSGRLFTASNGNSLFLPAAGGYWDDGVGYEGEYGYYWSRSLFDDNPFGASACIFSSIFYCMDGSDRCLGRSIRAVCTKHQK